MMRFSLAIEIDNAAFHDDEGDRDAAPELGRLLRQTADAVEAGTDAGPLRDVNGNTVGSFFTL